MAKSMNGLSRDLIIHPGETLQEVLEDRKMTQKELAGRTGVTEKHVSKIVNGKGNISSSFAKKLEYALGIKASFWMKLQSNYDQELLEFEEFNNVSKDEISILKKLKEFIEYAKKINILRDVVDNASMVLELRNVLAVSNLLSIPKIPYNGAYRAQTSNTVDVYVLFAWQKLCEIITRDIIVAEKMNIECLKTSINEIKSLIGKDPAVIDSELRRIFAKCGIAFSVVRHFKGAPVHGFIKYNEDEKLILCMTIRKSFADIFWFTLFHEIGHILNGDVKDRFIDFESVHNEKEDKADDFSKNTLINHVDFKEFCECGNFSLDAIKEFSEIQGVMPYIIIGRLQKEEYIPWSQYVCEKTRFKWVS